MKLTRPGRRRCRRFKHEGVCLSLMQGCKVHAQLSIALGRIGTLACLGRKLVTCLPRHDEVRSVALDNQPRQQHRGRVVWRDARETRWLSVVVPAIIKLRRPLIRSHPFIPRTIRFPPRIFTPSPFTPPLGRQQTARVDFLNNLIANILTESAPTTLMCPHTASFSHPVA